MDEAIERAGLLIAGGGRVLGISGAPGSGKSTVAAALLAHFGGRAALLPMDGFHLSNAQLSRLGRANRKGAPDTFDADGYLATLRRVQARAHDVYAPRFDRDTEESVANDLVVPAAASLVITEGNYLLLNLHPWCDVRPLLDEAWCVDIDPVLRRRRLIERHVEHGRSEAEAAEWVDRSDEANALLVAAHSLPADVTLAR
jgi:pantothenate kinase